MMSVVRLGAFACVVGLVAAPTLSWATDYEATPDNYRSLLSQLGPGDRLLLSAGTYADGLPIYDIEGTDQAPIVIAGPQTGPPAVFVGRNCCNTIALRNAAYVTVRNVEVDQQGTAGDAVKAEGSSYTHHITLENMRLSGFGNNQQIVGISTKCPAWDWVIRNIEIRDAGTGLYLGDSTGEQSFVRGLIEHVLVVDPIGYAMQIKHQNRRSPAPGMPTEDAVTVIRHNVFIKAAGASTGGLARPNLLVGTFPGNGNGSRDRYEIYGNFLYQNASGTEGLFQGEGNVAFYSNVLFNSFGSGIAFQQNNGPVRETAVFNNTVVVSGTGIRVSSPDPGFTQTVYANAVFAGQPLSGGSRDENAVGQDASSVLNAPSGGLGSLDLYPQPGSLSGRSLNLAPFTQFTDYNRDFNGDPRTGSFVGAYSGDGVNPGWALAEAVKTLGPLPPVPDAGVPGPELGPDGGAGGGTPDAADPGSGGGRTPDAGTPGAPNLPGSSGDMDRSIVGGCRTTGAGQVAGWLLAGLAWVLFRSRRLLGPSTFRSSRPRSSTASAREDGSGRRA